MQIRHVQEIDRDFWLTLDRHLPENQFVQKIRDKQGYVLLVDGVPGAIEIQSILG